MNIKTKQILIGIILIAIFIVSCDENNPTSPTTTNDINTIYPNYYLDLVHQGATVDFDSDFEDDMYIKAGNGDYVKASSYTFDTLGIVNLSVKVDTNETQFIYNIVKEYPKSDSGYTTAVDKDDEKIKNWANAYENFNIGEDVSEANQTLYPPEKSLGQAEGISTDVVVLGNGGDITLTFPNGIANGEGIDFAVYENGLSPTFLEIAYVEVSTDGETFVRFDTVSLNTEPIGAFGVVDTTTMYGVAGKYKAGIGTGFDLEHLKYKEEVINGDVDLDNIEYVRIVDIIGAYEDNDYDHELAYDSFGNIIYDIYKTVLTGGFDLDAIGVINEAR